MKISDVQLFELSGQWNGPQFPPGDRQARPLDIYPEFNIHDNYHLKSGDLKTDIFLEIHTDDGLVGIFGPIESYQAYLIASILRPFLLGRDPLAVEVLNDQMLRMHRHGRSGMFVTAVSSVDCALWDLRGKWANQPVYKLLGGPTRAEVPAYASMLGSSVEPELAAQAALEVKDQGYSTQKWFFRYGPGDGEAGKSKNLAMARAVRAAVGDEYSLAFDAFMGWDEPYAVELFKAMEPVHPLWIEEPLFPERTGSLAKIRAQSSIPLATGEHVYTRWQVKELLAGQAVDVLQTDPDWTGGISEQVKICVLASAYDVPVYAHGHSLLPALHIAAAQTPSVVPMVEYLLRHQANKQFFFNPQYIPINGKIALPALPGLGIRLDELKIQIKHRLSY